LVSLGQIDPYRSNGYGLISQLTWAWWLGLAGALAAVAVALVNARALIVCPAVILLVFILFGTMPAVEPVARFAAAYATTGFSSYVASHGHVLPNVDARALWPGDYAAIGFLSRAMHVPPYWFIAWAPVVLNLSYLFPIKALANATLTSRQAQWATLPLFLIFNWVGQSYLSAQGINYLIYLTVLCIVIRVFGARDDMAKPVRSVLNLGVTRSLARHLHRLGRPPALASEAGPEAETPGRMPAPPADRESDQSRLFLLLLLLLIGASIVSHQFTPAVIAVVLLALTLLGRIRLKGLWLIVAVATVAWLSWVGQPFWVGHIREVFGGVTQLGSSFSSNVGSRVGTGHVPGRSAVQYARAFASILTWALAAAAAINLWRKGRPRWTMLALVVAPAALVFGVTYGGEAGLRVLLFGLAPASILIASGLERGIGNGKLATAVPIVAGLALAALFPLTAYGNEAFEAFTPDEVAAARYVNQKIPQGSLVIVANPNNPLSAGEIGRFRENSEKGVLHLDPTEITTIVNPIAKKQPVWIYLSRGQEKWSESMNGYQPGWLTPIQDNLMKTGHVQVVFHSSTATVYEWTVSGPTGKAAS
jgi:hypothetical protein